MRVNGGDHPGLFYIFSDHLGSTSVMTDTSGGNPKYTSYFPFGETRYTTGNLPTDRLYIGQQQNSYIKLMNYRSRWYDSALGRFISPDSIIPNSSPQSLNRYSYVNNNPVNYNDPSGHCLYGNIWVPDTTGGCRNGQPLPGITPLVSPTPPGSGLPTPGTTNGDTINGNNGFYTSDPCAGLEPSGVTFGICQTANNAPKIEPCSLGWVSAATKLDGSCGHADINGNAIIDPFAWDHVMAPIGGGTALITLGTVMIEVGVGLCSTVAGCILAVPGLILPGGAGIITGGYFIYFGAVTNGRKYINDIFIIR